MTEFNPHYVSRETSDHLAAFATLVRKWNPHINLMAPSALLDLEARHVADGVETSGVLDSSVATWTDIGSGAGFPGVVVAILRPSTAVTLIEADKRKAEFLRTVRRTLAIDFTVLAARSEDVPPQNSSVISARALAPLARLLPFAVRHGTPKTHYIFPKGASWMQEHEDARREWSYDVRAVASQGPGVQLVLTNVIGRSI